MFNSDKPINSIEEDLLGRHEFARNIANAILAYRPEDSLTIGLYGEWGSGKTSLINMIELELGIFDYISEDEIPIIIKFCPWNFSDQNQLLEQFFLTLSNGLDIDNIKDRLNKLGNVIEKVGQIVDIGKYLPVISSVAQIVSPLIHDYATALKSTEKGNNLQKIKDKISKELRKIKTKLIIIIDDIDRLNNLEIRQIFQLVKSLGDFPNTIYLLPFDKAVVINALKDVQKGDGNEYLEKIIQIPIEIPNVNINKVFKILFEKIDNIIEGYPENRFDKEYWGKVLQTCIQPFIKNIRDVNRLVNILMFKYYLIKDEVNVIDLIALCSFQLFAPEIYDWIRGSKNSITGSTDYNNSSRVEQETRKKALIEEFKQITDLDSEIALEAISTIFPRIGQKINFSYQCSDNNELIRSQRIACVDKFDLYFSLSIHDVKITRAELENIIFNLDSKDSFDKVIDINKKNASIEFLIEFRSLINTIPIERVPILLEVIINASDYLIGIKATLFIETTAFTYCEFIITDLLKKYEDKNDRYEVFVKVIEDPADRGLAILTHIFNKIELSHGRLVYNGNDYGEPLLELEHLLKLEVIMKNKIEEYSKKNNLLDNKNYRILFYIWNCFDETQAKTYIAEKLNEPVNIAKFIDNYSIKWTGSSIKWEFKGDEIEKYIEVDHAENAIITLKGTEDFKLLNENIKLSVIAFILWKRNNSKENEGIDISEVQKELKNWEKN